MRNEIPSLTPRIVWHGVKLFFIVVCFLSAALWTYYTSERNTLLRQLEDNELLSVQLGARFIQKSLNEVTTDINVVGGLPELAAYLDSPTPAKLNAVDDALRNFSNAKRIYDQVRFLDERGMELARVNYGPDGAEAVPKAELQSKFDRYYFTSAVDLPPGDIFISPLDLNVEHGEIEVPFKPTLRIASPVYDAKGRKRGVLVLNYQGNRILEQLEDSSATNLGHMMLLNQEGYWLKGVSSEDEWGFMFPALQDRTLEKRWPEAWSRMKNVRSGQFLNQEGLFTFEQVRPFSPTASAALSAAPYWTVGSWVSDQTLREDTLALRRSLGLFGALMFVVVAPGCGAFAWLSAWRESTARALRGRDKLYKTLAENFPNGVVMLMQPDLSCVLAEGRGLEQLGLDRERLVGRHVLDVFPLETGKMVEEKLLKAMQGEEVVFEVDFGGKYFQSYIVPVYHDQGGLMAEMIMVHDITECKKLEYSLQEAATVDPLTGLHNRRRFDELLDILMGLARRYDTPLCLCMCDIDHFKLVNDTYGHATGDSALMLFGETLRAQVRQTDHVVRLGGDEFAILFPQTEPATVVEVLERIRLVMRENRLESGSGAVPPVTGSFGVARYISGMTAAGFMETADLALYAAKREGRDRVLFQPSGG